MERYQLTIKVCLYSHLDKLSDSLFFPTQAPNGPALSCGADNYRNATNELSSSCSFHLCNDLYSPCLSYEPADNCFLVKPAGDAHSVSLSASYVETVTIISVSWSIGKVIGET